MAKPICPICKLRPCYINYYYKGKPYYRKKCRHCQKHSDRPSHGQPVWKQKGYQKRACCDRCGFRSSINQVFSVYFVDGNLRNTQPNNLRTLCANCQIILSLNPDVNHVDLTSDF